MGMRQFEIEVYETEDGKVPFEKWILSLKDPRAKLAIAARIERARIGDFGDWKPLKGASGMCEMRIHYAQGFRLMYALVDQKLIVFLAGSTKQEQDRTIAKAKDYWTDYTRRKKR
jgi:putative addiction module killer protein